jgi:hypothetical protein
MAITYYKLISNTLLSNNTSIEISGIPATFDDLVVFGSLRATASNTMLVQNIKLNNNLSNYNRSEMYAQDSAFGVESNVTTSLERTIGRIPGSIASANTFNSFEMFIPKYSGSQNKIIHIRLSTSNNSSAAWDEWFTILHWDDTSAISTIAFETSTGNIASGSTLSVYGVKYT